MQEVQQARETASQLGSIASSEAGAAPTVIDALREKVRQVYADNKDVISNLDTAQANYYASPSSARNTYQNIFNPFQRESLVSSAVSNAAVPYQTASALYGQRVGRTSDLVDAGTRAYQAQVQTAAAKADNAWRNYQAVLNEYNIKADEAARAEAAKKLDTTLTDVGNHRVLIDNQTGNVIKDLGLSPSSGSGTGTAAERERDRQLNNLKNDILNGATLEKVVSTYGGTLERSDILNTYNQYSRYGAYKETPQQIENLYKPPKPLTAQDKLNEATAQAKLDLLNKPKPSTQGLVPTVLNWLGY